MAEPRKINLETAAIDDDLAWIDINGKPNIDILLSQAGIKEPAEVKRATNDFKNSTAMLALREIIRQRYATSSEKDALITDPTWPFQVAYREGYRKALREIYQSIPIRSTDRNTIT